MFNIICYCANKAVSEAEAETPEAALLAARTLWDEAWTGMQGCRRRLVVTGNGVRVEVTSRP